MKPPSARTVASIVALALKLALVAILMNDEVTAFVYQNF